MSTLDGLKLRRCRTTALLLALIITSKRTYSDTIAQRMRTRPMHLPTEMVRAFLPPRSIGTGRVVSTAVLEPAYELGGDAFDHGFTEDVLHATILDGMGNNLASGLATSVAMAGCRNARRSGANLNELVGTVDLARLMRWGGQPRGTGECGIPAEAVRNPPVPGGPSGILRAHTLPESGMPRAHDADIP
ncbi:hypothetical protein [Streptomyces hirsutus]|uniref:hypothetical protein n=1 Tax=Streptomyces hirsutus TaxID=35620 RepID=UPI003F4B0A0B